MGNRYRLVGLKNSELLAGLSELVQRSNAITAEELAHLAELEDRMLHLELGFPSLFAYCVEALGMSEGAAGRRVAAARVCRRFPEAFERAASGDLHLSALCALSPHLDPGNASELFATCQRKTRRQIEELLAARFPRPDVREQIRRLPMRAYDASGVDVAGPRRRELEALSADRFGVHFTADAELRELIERARALASHRLPKGDLSSLMKLALETFVQHEEKRRFAVRRKPRAVQADTEPAGTPATQLARASTLTAGTPTPPGGASALRASAPRKVTRREPTAAGRPRARFRRAKKRSRYLSAPVTRSVYVRDQGPVLIRVGGRAALRGAGVLAARSHRALGGAGRSGSREHPAFVSRAQSVAHATLLRHKARCSKDRGSACRHQRQANGDLMPQNLLANLATWRLSSLRSCAAERRAS
jgi:hypothetical protein